MAFFTTIDQVKEILGGAVNKNAAILTSMEPYFELAWNNYLDPWLGNTLKAHVETAAAAPSPTAAQANLLAKVRASLAWFTYYEFAPFQDAELGTAGRYRIESDDRKTLFKYQENRLNAAALLHGYEALERLLLYLESTKGTDWPDWKNDSPGYARFHGVLLNTATAARAVHAKKISRRAFETMLGKVQEVEAIALVPLLGEDQYDALLAARRDADWTTQAVEEKVIQLANWYTCHQALAEAIRENLVQFDGDRVVQSESTGGDAPHTLMSPDGLATGTRLLHHDELATRHLNRLKAYLTANVDDAALADYKAWVATQAAAAEAYELARQQALCADSVTGCSPCSDTSERLDGGNAHGFGNCPQPTRKGAVRL